MYEWHTMSVNITVTALLVHRKIAGVGVITVDIHGVAFVAVESSGDWKEGDKNSQAEERKGGGGEEGGRNGKYGGENQAHPHPCHL